MGLLQTVLLAASLGSSAVIAAGHGHRHHHAPPSSSTSSSADTSTAFKAHIESTQTTLLTPSPTATTRTKHRTGEGPTNTVLHTPTLKLFFPIIQHTESSLMVPSQAAPTTHPSTPKSTPQKPPPKPPQKPPANTPDKPPGIPSNDSPEKTPDEPPMPIHIILGGPTPVAGHPPSGEDTPEGYTPGAVNTIWNNGTPYYVGAGLPPAVVKGTTYSVGPTGNWLVNGKPVSYPKATNAPDTPPSPHQNHPHGYPASGKDWSGHHPEPTGKALKKPDSTANLPGKKPAAAASGSLTWTGPGLTTETGLSTNAAAAAAANLIPGISLAIICLLVALM